MVAPTIGADRAVLSRLISLGASLFPVSVALDDNGKCQKIPKVKEWQKTAQHSINCEAMLNGHAAYGFHPETIGAVVIDLDRKGDKDGEDELVKLLGRLPAITDPEVYVDSPNGRHLYFRRDGLPPALMASRNGILPGVDYRGHHGGGWLVAPGSVGYSARRQDWCRYELEGDLASLPVMPSPLVELLSRQLSTSISLDTLPDFISPAKPEEMLPEIPSDPKLAEMFRTVGDVIRSPRFFDRLIERFVPDAVRVGNDWVTGDYSGAPGSSCKWTPSTGIIKDFASNEKGGDFLWWIERQFGLLPIAAAKLILETLGLHDPTAGATTAQAVGAASIQAAAATAPVTGNYPESDSGNALRLVTRADGALLYNASSDIWMAWSGTHWVREEGNSTAMRLALEVAHSIAQEVVDAPDPDPKVNERRQRFALKSEAAERRKAMVTLAAVDGPRVKEEDFDPNPDLFSCRSGTIDLRTGELQPHSKDDLITCVSPMEYSRHPAPRFALFISECFEHDQSVIEWMQTYLGYSLTGHTSAQLFPIWWGGGQNGKSQLLDIMGTIMGTYCKKASADTWLQNRGNQPVRDDLATLRGARFVWASEPDEGRKLSTSVIKEITGGDPITCRHLYGRLFTYKPTFKTVFVTNHRPKVHSQDFGIWRRLRFIPFLYKVPEDRKIPDLGKKLIEEEGPEILGWLVEGAMKWYAHGLPECDKIANATADLKEGDDVLAEFVMEKCVMNPSCQVKFDQLWLAYRTWNDDKGIKIYLGRNSFRSMLAEKAQFEFRKQTAAWVVYGLGLKAELSS